MQGMFEGMLCLAILSLPQTQAPAKPDRAAIREVQKRWWDTLETIEFECLEFAPGADPKGGIRHEFAQATGGRRGYHVWQVGRDGERMPLLNQRDDGTRTFRLEPFAGHPTSVSRTIITDQVNTPDRISDYMFNLLWLMTPGGRPVFHYLDEGAKLEARPGSGREVEMTARGDGISFRCILDPDHDWLPREIRFPNAPSMYGKVTRFSREGGHWFPIEGEFTSPTSTGGPLVMRFRVDGLRINRTINDARFALPQIPPGVFIVDETTDRSWVRSKKGPLSTSQSVALRARYAAPFRISNAKGSRAPSGAWTRLSRILGIGPWWIALIGSCLAAFGLVVLARRRPRGAS